jgi:hypothetical protein
MVMVCPCLSVSARKNCSHARKNVVQYRSLEEAKHVYQEGPSGSSSAPVRAVWSNRLRKRRRNEGSERTSIALKIGAHNCYCLMRTDLGQQWAVKGLRSLQRYLYGAPAVVMIVVGDEYELLTAEELVALLGVQVRSPLDLSLQTGKG